MALGRPTSEHGQFTVCNIYLLKFLKGFCVIGNWCGFQNPLSSPSLSGSGFFNGSKLFGRDEDEKAAGTMFIIMGLLWLVAVPFTILLLILVSSTSSLLSALCG